MIQVAAFALILLGAAHAAPADGSCVINGPTRVVDGPSRKSCSDCQWQCLTMMNGACASMTFDNVTTLYNDLDTLDCGDGKWLTRSSGLCVLFDANGAIIDTQEQNCLECRAQCLGWAQCGGMVFNYVTVPRAQLPAYVCPTPSPRPTPPPASPAVLAPKPSPATPPPVVPSPAVPAPKPSPATPPPPSPATPPPPSPKVPSSPFIGINIIPGVCNASTIRYVAPVVVTSVQSYNLVTGLNNSDSCCGLCKQDPRCNIMAFCSQPGGCGNDCVNGVAPFDQATELGPGAQCLPGGRYPLGTCQLQFAPNYLAIPRDSINFDGWISALIVPEVQSQFNNLPTVTVTPRPL